MNSYPWLWDVEMDQAEFERLLRGGESRRSPGLDADWALVRLIEHAPYRELRRLLPVSRFAARWPELSSRLRSASRREGMDYMLEWLGRKEGVAHE